MKNSNPDFLPSTRIGTKLESCFTSTVSLKLTGVCSSERARDHASPLGAFEVAKITSRSTDIRAARGGLTVKLRGRAPEPDQRRGRTISSSARGARPQAHHGPLQRLLEGSMRPPVKPRV